MTLNVDDFAHLPGLQLLTLQPATGSWAGHRRELAGQQFALRGAHIAAIWKRA